MSPALRVALVHYHLRPGGVTTVLRHAAAALAGQGAACVVLAGAPPPAGTAPWPVPIRAVPGLDYGGTGPAAALRAQLEAVAAAALGGPPDVWYIHNHSLGRCLPLLPVVRALADAGAALLLHLHDFSEDGRPAFYQALRGAAGPDPRPLGHLLYPCGPRVHYAALTTRDADLLARAGAPAAQVHHLPNPVALEGARPGPAPGHGLRLYPTRAIRRKNLGEFLLWSACAPAGTRWATTLAPRSPADLAVYARWTALAHACRLPVDFAVGEHPPQPLAHWLAAADEVFTTSVSKGFGLAFLEPWLAGRPVRGRDLPEITADFRRAGVALPGLYERLDVPLEWVGAEALRAALGRGLRALAAYGRTATAADEAAARADAVRGDAVDFGRLDEPLQQRVIERVCAEPGAWMPPPAAAVAGDVVTANRQAIAQHFGADACGPRLWAACCAAAGGAEGPVSHLDAEVLLDFFLEPARFRLLRT